MAKRASPPDSEPPPSLPHNPDREGGQPYAREVEDYQRGVANPPKEHGEQEGERERRKRQKP
jgi:hypothetical protein